MNIFIKSSKIQFRNPQVGQPTRATAEHYESRRIIAEVDGEERDFNFTADEMPFNINEEKMKGFIILRLEEDKVNLKG